MTGLIEPSIKDVVFYLETHNKSKWKHLIKIIQLCERYNPYINSNKNYSNMWLEQCGINLPLMYVCSIYLYIYAKERNIDTFLFATRDCSQWFKIFSKMFPKENSIYYNCSRNMFDIGKDTQNKYFKQYTDECIKTSVKNAVYIDIHGTGRHPLTFFKEIYGEMPHFFMISSSYRNYSEFPDISIEQKRLDRFINLVFDARGTPIEMLNYDIVGTMKNYDKNGAQRCDPEYSLKYLEAYHVCIDYACLKIESLKLENIREYDLNELFKLIRKIYRVIQDNRPVIAIYMKHPIKHPKILSNSDIKKIEKLKEKKDKEHKEHKEHKDHKDLKDLKEHKEHKEHKDLKDLKDLKDHKDHKDHKEHKDHKVQSIKIKKINMKRNNMNNKSKSKSKNKNILDDNSLSSSLSSNSNSNSNLSSSLSSSSSLSLSLSLSSSNLKKIEYIENNNNKDNKEELNKWIIKMI